MRAIGHRTWAIPEGYLPPRERPEPRALESHEAACVLNAGDEDAHLELRVFFADREPAGPYRLTVGARRTLHLRLDDLRDPEPIPRGTDYATVIRSDVPVVVQHTRLDARRAESALMTTLAWAADEEGA
ncbi:sensory rhodopsin transducer [Anaeromyxobacter sp. PSR-1]|uniref:sensory rhodopsin transducer n=1 Tax=unclassified Anaeromyxobacter TaxID=2620896 RepID=UPI0005E821FB|nr:sensory rhodopsin transducer [Anaeromyxobacter sp. PSR-1]GAO02013.1 anabaena sensory rhodopsin transducer [Anaeromyxobacter sp. PSR-1]